jgi:hypothetical protein
VIIALALIASLLTGTPAEAPKDTLRAYAKEAACGNPFEHTELWDRVRQDLPETSDWTVFDLRYLFEKSTNTPIGPGLQHTCDPDDHAEMTS